MKEKTIYESLGANTQYKTTYDKSLLVREKRETNRINSNITSTFYGYDVWNGYEFSFLLKNGKPFFGRIKIIYSSSSTYIVESKSLKLYFNSFNMTKVNEDNEEDSKQYVINIIKQDMSYFLETNVDVDIHTNYTYTEQIDDKYKDIDTTYIDNINTYIESPSLLNIKEISNNEKEEYLTSSLLRSNCKVTHQPDWGIIYIYYMSRNIIDKSSLLKYIISFRNENHFHEEIVETIYDRLYKILNPSQLTVMAKYTRRGGIDINPIRTNNLNNIKDMKFIDINTPHIKTFYQ